MKTTHRMRPPIQRSAIGLAVSLVFPYSAFAQEAKPDVPKADVQLQAVDIQATRARLDAARNGLAPDTGSTLYRLDRQDIENLPLGDATPLNRVLLQTPGVVQDSYGQLHVRGDHANVQYRINGIIIPEAIGGFGQSLETRFAERLNILTGALPAQYGLRNAAVVDIQTRTESTEPTGSINFTGGSHGHAETSGDISGSSGAFSYYLTGSLLRNDLGIENPTGSRDALHDTTRQAKTFGTLSYLLDKDSRVSLLFGSVDNRFQIPNVPGETPNFTLAGAPAVDSSTLDARQRERNSFVALSYQGAVGADVDYQVSVFHRLTDVRYQPDPVGDLVFNGIAADILRRNVANGLQADLAWRLDPQHTLRTGLFAQRERFNVNNQSSVFPADDDGNQTSTAPLSIADNSVLNGRLWGAYLQDEWKPTKALTVNYGLRYDQVNTVVDEQQLSPRLGLVFDVDKTLRLHAGFARYFTPPPTEKIDTTSVQKFLGTTNALPSDANTAVKSERSDYWDAGLAWQATSKLTLGVDGYYRKVRHLQDEGQFGNALIFSAFNYAQGRIFGLDLTASYRDGPLNAYANVSLTHARGRGIETGQFNFDPDELAVISQQWVHLDHEQRLTGSAGISYRLSEATTVSADALYGSGLRNGFANTEHLPSYTTVNLGGTQALNGGPLGKVDLRVAVINAFDRVYQLRDGSGIGVGAPQFGQRRSLYVGIGKQF